jgi:hypothetical protein
MPLQFERRRQFVDALVERLHHAIVAAINCDFARPNRAARFSVHNGIRRHNPRASEPSKTFSHPFQEPGAIVPPLVLIFIADEIGYSIPVSIVDRVKKILAMQPDLMLRPPQPNEIQRDRKDKRHAADGCTTQRNRHTPALFPADIKTAEPVRVFLNDGSGGSFTQASRSSRLGLTVNLPITCALAGVPRVPIDLARHVHHNCQHDEERDRAHEQRIILLAQCDVQKQVNPSQAGTDH